MKVVLPPPLEQAPPARPAWHDFKLLIATQLRVTWNKIRHWPRLSWLAMAGIFLFAALMISLIGSVTYDALKGMNPEAGGAFLSLIFMVALAAMIFFGITAAFATLYMSDDLEILFMAPVATRAVFAVKSLVVAGTNFLPAALLIILPGIFFGILFTPGPLYYLWLALSTAGLLAIGTALAEMLNMLVMRIVPPHRSREAVGVIGALGGITIALLFQIPNLVMSSGRSFDLGAWLSGQQEMLKVMDYLPWGWGARALAGGISGDHLAGLGWSALLVAGGAATFAAAFLLVERGFRGGWITLSQGEGRRRKRRRRANTAVRVTGRQANETVLQLYDGSAAGSAPAWQGLWSVARKDLLYLKRDTREWFGYMTPLIVMVFFIAQYLFMSVEVAQIMLVTILIMYVIMFSGNFALQSFGREGESEWILNSVPLAGWPVVWGKLLGAVLPTLVLMMALLVGTGLAIGLSATAILGLAVGALLITLGSSAIGLLFSINNSRYNPENPQFRISAGASMLMYLINIVFVALMAIGVLYIFPPRELMPVIHLVPPVSFSWGFPDLLIYLFYMLTRPLLWPETTRLIFGVVFTTGIWALVFFGFVSATVKQSLKGFRVELVTGSKKKALLGSKLK